MGQWVNTLRPRQNGRHFADDMLNAIFLNENVCIPIKISLKFVPKGPIDNIPSLVQIMAWRRPGDRPLSEPMMVRLPTHICVTRPQWVNAQQWQSKKWFRAVGCLLWVFWGKLIKIQWDPTQGSFWVWLSQWETMLQCNIVSYWLSHIHNEPCESILHRISCEHGNQDLQPSCIMNYANWEEKCQDKLNVKRTCGRQVDI